MSTASPPPLTRLVRPEHMLDPKLRFSGPQIQRYIQGCRGLWKIIQTDPEESMKFRQAHKELARLTHFLMTRVLIIQTTSTRSVPIPENPFQTLMRQTSDARPIPSWSDFEAGVSAFHESAPSSASMLDEDSFDSIDAKGKSTQENVAVALTSPGCDVKSRTADEIEAAWALLDMKRGTRG